MDAIASIEQLAGAVRDARGAYAVMADALTLADTFNLASPEYRRLMRVAGRMGWMRLQFGERCSMCGAGLAVRASVRLIGAKADRWEFSECGGCGARYRRRQAASAVLDRVDDAMWAQWVARAEP